MSGDFRERYKSRWNPPNDREGYFVMPTIEYDGGFSELEVSNLTKPHEKITQRRGPARHALQSTELYMDRDLYTPIKYGFKIDEARRVYTTVFVHEAFMRGVASDQRTEVIRRLIRKNAAWFFSYGERR